MPQLIYTARNNVHCKPNKKMLDNYYEWLNLNQQMRLLFTSTTLICFNTCGLKIILNHNLYLHWKLIDDITFLYIHMYIYIYIYEIL